MLKRVSQSVAGDRPFDLLAFLEGPTQAIGLFEDRLGRVKRSFTADMQGHRRGNILELTESFLFDNGVAETRVWRLTPDGRGSFAGMCHDAIGEAIGVHGQGTATMTYRMGLEIGRRKITFGFRDLFVAVDDTTVLNRATVSKWGLRVGQVLIVFRKASSGESANGSVMNKK